MQIYCVGGAVRDEILGLAVKDRDYVVVGSTPEEMIKLGFKPVGNDFPVFLHPHTHEEYALARTERKTTRGYKGFKVYAEPEVTLEEDLARRDLTINAIAKDAEGRIIDPFRGVDDLKAGILRHVGPAFVEDPVRILRVARFAARFGFAVAPTTLKLMREMVDNGEVGALVAERVWQEVSIGLMENKPSAMFLVLQECGAFSIIMPELAAQFQKVDPSGMHTLRALDMAAINHARLTTRFAILNYHFGDEGMAALPHTRLEYVKNLCRRLKAPNDSRDLALLTVRLHVVAERALQLSYEEILELFDAADAYRKPERFLEMLEVCEYAYGLHRDREVKTYAPADRLKLALQAARAVDAGEVACRFSEVTQIKREVFQARVEMVKKSLSDATTNG